MSLSILSVFVRGPLNKSSPPSVVSRSGATNPRPLVLTVLILMARLYMLICDFVSTVKLFLYCLCPVLFNI